MACVPTASPIYNFESAKQAQLGFHALLIDGERQVHFEWVAVS
jgi:hypothetical protein